MKKKLIFAVLIGLFVFANSGDLFARGGGGGGRSSGGGGSRSFSSPSRSFSAPSRPSAPARPAMPSTGGSSSWWSKGSSPATPKATTPLTPTAPNTTVNKGIADAMSGQRSQEKFQAHEQMKTTSPATASVPRKSSSDYFKSNNSSANQQRVRDLKKDLNYERMQNRDLRQQQRFGNYYNTPAPMVYHDSFNPWFWMWLMSQNNNARAETIYHHKDEMDPERYKDLLAKDTELETKIKELEAKGIKQDPSYIPPELKDDKDLMYSGEAVKVAYDEEHSSSFPWFWTIVGILLIGGVAIFVLKAKVIPD